MREGGAQGGRVFVGRDNCVYVGRRREAKSFVVCHAFCLRFSASFSYVLFMLLLLLLLLFLLLL